MLSASELKKQILFEDIEKSELEKVTGELTELSLKKGDSLFKEGDETKGIYLVRSGKVEISKVTPDAWKQTLAVLTPGHFFGELSIMEKRLHEANASALEKTDLFLLKKEVFEKMEKENPVLAMEIFKKIALIMSRNLRRMNEKFLNALINY
jgi:CRP/FNR family cyclic AMP-dependent transcriptional regulator